MSKSREQLIKYLSEIDITDKVVLDAGCGPKEKWASNFTKGEPKEYVTLDVDKKFNVDITEDLNSGVIPFGVIKKGRTFIGFDIIFCLETLEHLWNPIHALGIIYKSLEEDGKLYLSTPFINPYHDEVDYARYTSEWYKKVLTEVGFKNIKIKARVATVGLPYLTTFYGMEGLRMSKTRLAKGQQKRMAEIGYFVEASK